MSSAHAKLTISTSPFLHASLGTQRIMLEVLATLAPVVLAASWYFGLGALLIVGAATAGAVSAERYFSSVRGRTLADGSGVLTGVLLGLTLPPVFPLWMAFLGGVVAIGLGKLVWGGLGGNIFNPALVGRAFLQAAFPTAITTWGPTRGVEGFSEIPASLFALPLMQGGYDGVSGATPLGLMKFDGQLTPWRPLLTGEVGGSLGETSALLLALCGTWMIYRKLFEWRLAAGTLGAAVLLGSLFHWLQPEKLPDGGFVLFSGGLMFAAVYMVTDPVTTPTTQRGAWVFGAGVGALIVLIRFWGGLPEGVMYAVLLMNAATPYINQYTQPRRFGG